MIRPPPRSTRTHSFPTRRPSDLEARLSGGRRRQADEALPRLLHAALGRGRLDGLEAVDGLDQQGVLLARLALAPLDHRTQRILQEEADQDDERHHGERHEGDRSGHDRSEEHTSELQSLMRISYAVFCLKKQKKNNTKANATIERQNKNNKQQ